MEAAQKEEDTHAGYLRFNLNLIVDRPDGLIKEGKKSLAAGGYLISSGKKDATSPSASVSAVGPWVSTF